MIEGPKPRESLSFSTRRGCLGRRIAPVCWRTNISAGFASINNLCPACQVPANLRLRWITSVKLRADRDWKADALQQREVDVDVEPLRLETGEAGGDGLEPLADGIEMVESLLEMEIGEVVGNQARCAGRWRTFRTASETRV